MDLYPIQTDQFRWYDYRRYSYSLGLVSGAGTFLSGNTASQFDAQSGKIVVVGLINEQVTTIYDKIKVVLEGAGLTLGDVTRIVEYVRVDSLDRYAEIAAVRAGILGNHRPAVSVVPVRALLRPDALIEVEITATSAPGTSSGMIYLPTLLPVDDQGQILGGDTAEGQFAAILDRAEQLLAPMELSLSHVVKATITALPGAAQQLASIFHERFTGLAPVVTEIVTSALPVSGALVQCDLTATTLPTRKVGPSILWLEEQGRSFALRAGKLVYIAGHSARNIATGEPVHTGDIAAQAEHIYSHINEFLADPGFGGPRLLKTIELVAREGLSGYRTVGAVRTRLLGTPMPAATGLVVEALANKHSLIEAEALAVVAE